MNEETQVFKREEPYGTSHFLQVSVRAWLAVGLIATICMTQVAVIVLAVLTKQPELLEVGEPLYTMSGMALAYYFGQKQAKPQSV